MRSLFTAILLTITYPLFAQQDPVGGMYARKPWFTLEVKKTGPYFGLQNGKYSAFEFGVERQWKAIRLSDAVTQAAHFGINYNFRHNVLGYDVGYWIKPHRFSLTYGATALMRTDFDRTKLGIAPAIGFKFWFLHFRTGYQFLPNVNDFENNTFFISIRVGIVNDREFELKRWKLPQFSR